MRTALAIAGLLMLSSVVQAQQPDTTIQIGGIEVWLGMSQDDALTALATLRQDSSRPRPSRPGSSPRSPRPPRGRFNPGALECSVKISDPATS